MAEASNLGVADELRRIIAGRRQRRRRLKLTVLIGAAAVPLLASITWPPPVLLLWNASASAPIGLYRVHREGPPRRGDTVVAWTPAPARSLASRRRYLPANVPLVKRVAAAGGDRVCAGGKEVSINGRLVAMRQQSDPAGRRMPWWVGCRALQRNEYLLLMDSPASFDGRYFGLTRGSEILGIAELLWPVTVRSAGDG
ncbi:MAG TPA: S26 family signal peptidase [Sphingomicrobium sp.]|nr:S26 family signal peptidase [Sphingomicrobium sp.]